MGGSVSGSVCSGMEAASLVAPASLEFTFVSEVDLSACSVLAYRYLAVPNLGDFTGIRNRWLKRCGIGSIDVLVGGTPCQAFSVAGLRGGMDDPRGGLAVEFLRLARRLRPPWLVWENVPGVLSSNGGRDFGSILGGLEELGYGWSYRVLDAQHFGVSQRRRRVFVVGYSGKRDGVAGSASREDIQRFSRISASVLFERHSLSGNPPPSREARSDVAGFTPGRIGGYKPGTGCLRANGGDIGGGQ